MSWFKKGLLVMLSCTAITTGVNAAEKLSWKQLIHGTGSVGSERVVAPTTPAVNVASSWKQLIHGRPGSIDSEQAAVTVSAPTTPAVVNATSWKQTVHGRSELR